jgi:hypothetical protein
VRSIPCLLLARDFEERCHRAFILHGLLSTARAGDPFNTAKFDVNKKVREHDGVLVLSAGAPVKCVSMVTHLRLAPRGATSRRQVLDLMDVDGWVTKSDFDDHAGKLVTIALPAGEWRIFPIIQNPALIRTSATPILTISIGADEIVSGGEVYLPQSCGFRVQITVNDRHERDFALLAKLNPELATKAITVRPAVLLAPPSN